MSATKFDLHNFDPLTGNLFRDPVTITAYSGLIKQIDKDIDAEQIDYDLLEPIKINDKNIKKPLVFERAFITAWIKKNPYCPFTNQLIKESDLIPVDYIRLQNEKYAKENQNDQATRFNEYWRDVKTFSYSQKDDTAALSRAFVNSCIVEHAKNSQLVHRRNVGNTFMARALLVAITIFTLSTFHIFLAPITLTISNSSLLGLLACAALFITGGYIRFWPDSISPELIGKRSQFAEKNTIKQIRQAWLTRGFKGNITSYVTLSQATTGQFSDVEIPTEYVNHSADLAYGASSLHPFISSSQLKSYSENFQMQNLDQQSFSNWIETKNRIQHVIQQIDKKACDSFPVCTPFYLQPISWIYSAFGFCIQHILKTDKSKKPRAVHSSSLGQNRAMYVRSTQPSASRQNSAPTITL